VLFEKIAYGQHRLTIVCYENRRVDAMQKKEWHSQQIFESGIDNL
jgi:hypothetical protein